eukprot:489906-Karenia_brevis.AAC.1
MPALITVPNVMDTSCHIIGICVYVVPVSMKVMSCVKALASHLLCKPETLRTSFYPASGTYFMESYWRMSLPHDCWHQRR